jgi:O-antigen/teichoic acid export membrane protein
MTNFNSLKENFLKNKILVENFTFLSVLQITNLILFLITVPYLFRVLGSQNYGLIVFAQTIAFYFSIFINFGFNLTATRDISVFRNDTEKISEIVSSVLIIKIIFFLLSLSVMIILTQVITELKDLMELFLLSMLACLSEALFPVWYFQGVEKMKYITFINVTTRILAAVLVFILIDSKEEYLVYPLLIGSGTVTGAIFALAVVFRKHRIVFRFQPFTVIRHYFNENILYFLSNVSTQIYINANKIIIGSFLGMKEVAYYDVAEKVINMVKVPFLLLGQTLFPKVARDRNLSFLQRIMTYMIISALVVISAIFVLSDPIVLFFSGSSNPGSISIMRILSLSLIPISVSICYGDLFLVNFGLKTDYAKMRFFGFLFYAIIFLGLFLFKKIGVIQIASLVLAVESFIAVYSYLLFRIAIPYSYNIEKRSEG